MVQKRKKLNVTRLDAPVGAIVEGWNPKAALEPDIKGEIIDALQLHQVLVFRGHDHPTDQELVRFADNFGNLIKGSEWFGDVDPVPEILRVNNVVGDDGIPEGTGAAASLEWHSDYSYVPTVGKESFLEAIELPANPPLTSFCSQYAALETLPSELVNSLRGRRAYHSITGYGKKADEEIPITGTPDEDGEFRKSFAAKRERNRKLGIERPDIPQAIHPVILRHPDTGREILYVSKGITRHILGMPEDESKALLRELHVHSTKPENVYPHEWQVGDMVMFDTLGTLHRREAWDPSQQRIMRQMSTLWTPPAEAEAA